VKNAVDGIDGDSIDGSKIFDTQTMIILNGGGDRGDEAGSPDCFLWIETALVLRCFPDLTFFKMA
jgi:hypothetical protein